MAYASVTLSCRSSTAIAFVLARWGVVARGGITVVTIPMRNEPLPGASRCCHPDYSNSAFYAGGNCRQAPFGVFAKFGEIAGESLVSC